MSATAIDSIIKHEGFRSKPYPDPIHGWEVPTFGYGFTHISERHARKMLEEIVNNIEHRLKIKIRHFYDMPWQVRAVLIEMAYQIGVEGLLKFENTIKFLQAGDFESAADEMLDSVWAKQTPARAQHLSDIVRHLT